MQENGYNYWSNNSYNSELLEDFRSMGAGFMMLNVDAKRYRSPSLLLHWPSVQL